jgi:uncharacterized membrane protein
VYQFWRDAENFPQFMDHVKEVMSSGDTYHWKVTGPAGAPVEFDTHVTQDIPNELISWESLPDSPVKQEGFVRFDAGPYDSTRVTVQMRYVPPAGAVGHAVAQLFGVDPRQAMNEDLMRLKGLLELNQPALAPRSMTIH